MNSSCAESCFECTSDGLCVTCPDQFVLKHNGKECYLVAEKNLQNCLRWIFLVLLAIIILGAIAECLFKHLILFRKYEFGGIRGFIHACKKKLIPKSADSSIPIGGLDSTASAPLLVRKLTSGTLERQEHLMSWTSKRSKEAIRAGLKHWHYSMLYWDWGDHTAVGERTFKAKDKRRYFRWFLDFIRRRTWQEGLQQKVKFTQGTIGITCKGYRVTKVEEGSQAARQGVQVGWRIIEINGRKTKESTDDGLISQSMNHGAIAKRINQRHREEDEVEWEKAYAYIEGKELHQETMTITEAKMKCKELQDCTGFYYQGDADVGTDEKLKMIFKDGTSVGESYWGVYTSYMQVKAPSGNIEPSSAAGADFDIRGSIESADTKGDGVEFVFEKAQEWPFPISKFYPVHFGNIAGVGLPMFYNFHILPLSMAFLLWVSLSNCTLEIDEEFSGDAANQEKVRDYVLQVSHTLLWVFCVLVVQAFCFKIFSVRFIEMFRVDHCGMDEYVLSLRGVPAPLTHEGELLELMQQHIPDFKIRGVSIGYDVEKVLKYKETDDKGVENESERRLGDEIFEMYERLCVKEELESKIWWNPDSVWAILSQTNNHTTNMPLSKPSAVNELRDFFELQDLYGGKVWTAFKDEISKDSPTTEKSPFLGHTRQVINMPLEKLMKKHKDDDDFLSDYEHFGDTILEEFRNQLKEDKKRMRELFNQEAKIMRGSGHVWVVFGSKAEAAAARRQFQGLWLEFPKTLKIDSHVNEVDDVDSFILERGEAGDELAAWRGFKTFGQMPKNFDLKNTMLGPGTHVLPNAENGKIVFGEGPREEGKWKPKQIKFRKFVKAFHDRIGEPPGVNWFNLGVKGYKRTQNIRAAFIQWIVVFVILCLLVYWPLFYYISLPYSKAQVQCEGHPCSNLWPGLLTQQIQGQIYGLSNVILIVFALINVFGIGFPFKHELDDFVIVFNLFMSFLATIINLAAAMYPYSAGVFALDLNNFRMIDADRESKLAEAIYNTMVPGFFFIGFFIGQALGLFLDTLKGWLLLHLAFVWKCLPDQLAKYLCTPLIPWNPVPPDLDARTAGHIFEAKTLGLAWDYANLLLMPVLCNTYLFVYAGTTGRKGQLFFFLMLWVAIAYLWHRFLTLRFSRRSPHADGHLNFTMLRLWGIPLAQILSASVFMRYRAWHGNMTLFDHLTVGLPIVSLFLVVYLAAMNYMMEGMQDTNVIHHEASFDTAQRRLRYDWFNCNPVHCLKSAYIPEDLKTKDGKYSNPWTPCPFEYGKEYLSYVPASRRDFLSSTEEEASY